MLERVLTQLFQKMNPGRKAIAKRVGNRLVFVTQDSAGCNDYLLEGTYTYDEVVKLNELTTYNAGFGFCKEIGPVAFIGIPNPAYASGSGYFKYKVRTYGSPTDESECYFEAYDEDEAKKISNYTVYGLCGLEAVAQVVKIAELNSVFDSRYKAKESREARAFSMDCKLKGKYPIEKYDRTLDSRFNFHLPDGTDYRLVEHEE